MCGNQYLFLYGGKILSLTDQAFCHQHFAPNVFTSWFLEQEKCLPLLQGLSSMGGSKENFQIWHNSPLKTVGKYFAFAFGCDSIGLLGPK